MARSEPTIEEREGYIEGLRDGQPRPVAARRVNKDQTGSAFRALIRKDPEFAAQVLAAEAEGLDEQRDLTRAVIYRRALNADDKSTKPLEMQAAAILPEYAYLKKAGGSNEHDPLTAPLVKTELLTSAQIEQLVTLIEYGQGKRPNPELQAEIASRKEQVSGHPLIDMGEREV